MSWTKSLALLISACLLPFLILEGGLRVFHSDNIEKTLRDHSNKFLPKHSEGVHKIKGTKIKASFDNLGFRLSENDCSEEDVKNVLIVGDSNISALFLNDGLDLGSQLSDQLNRQDCFDVDSFGVSGFGPDQALFAIEHFAETKDYDFVVFHIFTDNDAGDLIRNLNKPQDGKVQNTGYCYLRKSWLESLLAARVFRRAFRKFSGHYLNWNTATHSLGNDEICEIVARPDHPKIIDAIFARAVLDRNIFNSNRVQIYMGDGYDIEFACRTNPKEHKFVCNQMEIISSSFKRLADKKGFFPMFLIQPSEYDVTDNHREISLGLSMSCANYKKTNLVKLFEDAIGEDVKIVSLYNEFDGCDECYYSFSEAGWDAHWNAEGVRRAAKKLTHLISQFPK